MRFGTIALVLAPFLLHCQQPDSKSPNKKKEKENVGNVSKNGNSNQNGNPDNTGTFPGNVPDVDACLKGELTPDPQVAAPAAGSVVKYSGAGRVRLRHEKEDRFAQFGGFYWEKRSFGFDIEDHSLTGDRKLVITFKPIGKHRTTDPLPNIRIFDTGSGNVFHINDQMREQPSPNVFRYTFKDPGNNASLKLEPGRVIEFEFGVFFDKADVAEGDTNYYTDTFRIELGKPGLVVGIPGAVGKKIDPLALAGGSHTVAMIYPQAEKNLSMSQNATNVQADNLQLFLEGRSLFHTNFTTGNHSEDGLRFHDDQVNRQKNLAGPNMDTTSCSECHNHNARVKAGTTTAPSNVLKIGVKAGDGVGAHPQFGLQLQLNERNSLGGKLIKETEMIKDGFADGTVVNLKKDKYRIDGQDALISPRIPAQVYGLGLLEAISEENIRARVNCEQGSGVTGRAVSAFNPETGKAELGRFGWKAGKTTLKHQVSEALLFDLGVTSPLMATEACEKTGNCAAGAGEVDAEVVKRMTAYTQLIGVPAVRNRENPAFGRGEKLFTSTGCSNCHVPKQVTGDTHPVAELRNQVFYPYTDLLVHDMGEGLADSKGEGQASASEWRTPPLWGLGLMSTVNGQMSLLHDGRAKSFEEAILWHGGEASAMSAIFRKMSKAERDDLIFFLNSI